MAFAPTSAPQAVTRRRNGRRATAFGGFVSSLPFLLPGVLLIGIFLLYPLVRAVYLSVMNWRGFGDPTFAGVGN